MWHVAGHVGLHLDGHALLQLKLVQLLPVGLPDHLLFHLFLDFEHLDHAALFAQHELGDLLAVLVAGKEWCHVDVGFCPVDTVGL